MTHLQPQTGNFNVLNMLLKFNPFFSTIQRPMGTSFHSLGECSHTSHLSNENKAGEIQQWQPLGKSNKHVEASQFLILSTFGRHRCRTCGKGSIGFKKVSERKENALNPFNLLFPSWVTVCAKSFHWQPVFVRQGFICVETTPLLNSEYSHCFNILLWFHSYHPVHQ